MYRILNHIKPNETIAIVTRVEPYKVIAWLLAVIRREFPEKGLVQSTNNKLLYSDRTKIIVDKPVHIECMFKAIAINTLFIQDNIPKEHKEIIKSYLLPVVASLKGTCHEFTWDYGYRYLSKIREHCNSCKHLKNCSVHNPDDTPGVGYSCIGYEKKETIEVDKEEWESALQKISSLESRVNVIEMFLRLDNGIY